MSKILQPDELKAIAQEIEWMLDDIVPNYTPHKVVEIKQFTGLQEDVFLVDVQFVGAHSASLMWRKYGPWEEVPGFTFYSPQFTPPTQKKEAE